MLLSDDVIRYIDKSVLCWLATVSDNGMPNVSPKEIFTHYNSEFIIVANIASPNTVRNIKQRADVCISFIDIFIQKGFQIKGKARIVDRSENDYEVMEKSLNLFTEGKFPFHTITKITVEKIKPIISPRYILYPETKEIEQIESAKKIYGIKSNHTSS